MHERLAASGKSWESLYLYPSWMEDNVVSVRLFVENSLSDLTVSSHGKAVPKQTCFVYRQFLDCHCVDRAATDSFALNYSATKGYCSNVVCPRGGHRLYLAFIFVLFVTTFFVFIPGLQVTLRVVPFSQRAFATGVQVRNYLSLNPILLQVI